MDTNTSGTSPALLGTYRDIDPLGLRIRQAAVRMFRDSLDQALDRVDRSLREDLKRAHNVASGGGNQARLEHLRALLGAGRRESMLLLDNLLGEHADQAVWPDDDGVSGNERTDRGVAEMPGAQWSNVQGAALSTMDVVSRGLVDTMDITIERIQRDNMKHFIAAWTAFGQDQERRRRMIRGGAGQLFRPENRAASHPFDVSFFARVIYLAHAAVGLITRNGADPYHVAVMTHLTDTVARALSASLREATILLVDAGFGVKRAVDLSPSATDIIAAEIMAAGRSSQADEHRNTTAPVKNQTDDTELFGSLCNLLSTWEPTAEEVAQVTRIAAEGVGIPMPALTPDETTSIISVLQTMVPPGLAEALGLGRGRIAAEIKSAMREQAKKQGITADLGYKDSRAVDLVDEAVDDSLVNRRLQNAARAIMARILFPSVKAAMKDQNGFASENNPARDFIGAMAEAVAPRDSAPRKEVLDKASEMVDNLVANFHEDLSIFTELTQEIRQHLEQAKLATAGERNQRRDDWRTKLQQRWVNAVVADPVRLFSTFLGAEHLSLREDRGSGGGMHERDSLQALDSLIRATSSARQRVRIDGVWRQNLLDMLASCGWHGVRAHSLLAEQEDLIHAFHVLGRTKFQDERLEDRLLHPEAEGYDHKPSIIGAHENALDSAHQNSHETVEQKAGTRGGEAPEHSSCSLNEKSISGNANSDGSISGRVSSGRVGVKNQPTAGPAVENTQPISGRSTDSGLKPGGTENFAAIQHGRTENHETHETIGNTVRTRPADHVAEVYIEEPALKQRPTERAVNERLITEGTNNETIRERSAISAPVLDARNTEVRIGENRSANVVPIRRAEEEKNPIGVRPAPVVIDEDGAERKEKPSQAKVVTLEDQTFSVAQSPLEAVIPSNDPVLSDRELLEKITGLPLNSWSTFVVSLGRSSAVRLSWVSPLSMKYLFVNKQGIRAVMGTPNELFLLARQGRFFPGFSPD